MLPEYRIAGILNASARERDERIQNMIEDVAQSSDVNQSVNEHVEETARHWGNSIGGGTARSRDPAQSLLQSMTKFWPDHAQEVVASMLNHAVEVSPGESFYNADIKNSIRGILVRQERNEQDFDLSTLISQTKNSEHDNIKRSLEAIRNETDNISPEMRDFISNTLVESFRAKQESAKADSSNLNAEIIQFPTSEELPTNG
ncbi:MAG: hypothetical protein ACRBDL_00450 [Alphaproteobacteria bacterium]